MEPNSNKNKYYLLKLVGLEAIPLAMGATFGGIGRATGAHWVPAIPPAMDLISIGGCYATPKGLWSLAKYGIGVALPYADKIYLVTQKHLPEISQFIQTLMEKI